MSEESGADAISLINSVPGMVIDIESRQPVLANNVGGLTGPAIRPIAVRMVWFASQAVSIPVIGMGGISSGEDAIQFFIAGATAVAVGTATFIDPTTPLRIVSEVEDYLISHEITSILDLVGTLEMK